MTPYLRFRRTARTLLEPLARLMKPGHADLAIAGLPSDHDAQADRLESFSRPLVMAAFWLQAIDRDGTDDPEDRAFRDKIAAWFRAGLVVGTDVKGPHYWGPDANYHQHHVEMGLMAIGLQFARGALWDPLSDAEKAQVAAWFATCRGGGIVNNNHLFMSIHILEFLRVGGFEHRTDRVVISTHLKQLETMYRGGGWFEDGINQAFDHYNSYAFHFYGLCWSHLHGAREPERAERWREWSRLFVRDYQHFFAANGEQPAFGRSLMYRFNAVNVFGLVSLLGCSDLPAGRLRRLCVRNVEFFMAQPIMQEQGCLSFGWTDRFDKIAEPYSCAGSPYWAAKGLTPLLMGPGHRFWTAPDDALPSERGDFAHAIPAAGLLLRGTGGDVEILNAGSMVGNTQLRYGAWKWSKLSYRTGLGFTLAKGDPATDWSFDSALTAELDNGKVYGRHSTVCVEMDGDHIGYACNFGFKVGQVNTAVETFVWWHKGWLLSVHHVTARQPVVLRQGGFALPGRAATDLPAPAASASQHLQAFANDGRGTAAQGLLGFDSTEWDQRLTDAEPRRHIHAPYHRAPVLRTKRLEGDTRLAALTWAGSDASHAAVWSVKKGDAGAWQLTHPVLGSWSIAHWALQQLI